MIWLHVTLLFILYITTGCVAVPFGSITTGLGVKTSDADCFIRIPEQFGTSNANFINKTHRILQAHPEVYEEVIAIPRANTPIVKFFHVPTETYCDVTFKTPLGVQNSKLIAFLLHADPRLIPLAVIIKYWAKVNFLSGTGKLTNYALTMLIIFYLQQAPVSILPSVAWLQQDPADEVIVDSWNAGFMHQQNQLPRSTNTSSISELLGGFFEYYANFNFRDNLVSPLVGYPIKKEIFQDLSKLPEELRRYKQNIENRVAPPIKFSSSLCIQDPFELCHNVSSPISCRLTSDIQTFIQFAALAYDSEKLKGCEGLFRRILIKKPLLMSTYNPVYRVHLFTHLLYKIFAPDWKVVIRGLIMRLFEDICCIKLTKIEENLPSEVGKYREKYSADLTHPVWRRREISKNYRAMKMTFEEKQKQITNEIMNEKAQFKLIVHITVTYFFHPRGIVLTLKQKEGGTPIYKEFGRFFSTVVNEWLLILLKPINLAWIPISARNNENTRSKTDVMSNKKSAESFGGNPPAHDNDKTENNVR